MRLRDSRRLARTTGAWACRTGTWMASSDEVHGTTSGTDALSGTRRAAAVGGGDHQRADRRDRSGRRSAGLRQHCSPLAFGDEDGGAGGEFRAALAAFAFG